MKNKNTKKNIKQEELRVIPGKNYAKLAVIFMLQLLS